MWETLSSGKMAICTNFTCYDSYWFTKLNSFEAEESEQYCRAPFFLDLVIPHGREMGMPWMTE